MFGAHRNVISDKLTHGSHIVVEHIGALKDFIIVLVAQAGWVQMRIINSTFGRRRGT